LNCLRGMQPRHFEVIMREHAWERYQERGGPTTTRIKLRRHLVWLLNEALDAGLHLDHTGAGWLEITPVLWATVRLTDRAWVVETITRWDEREVS